MAVVLREEGGFVDNPEDPGGATNMGITLRTLTAWRHRPTSIEDVRSLTVAEAERIYRAHYWNAMDCDALPAGVDLMVFDFGVSAGPEEAIRALQRAVGTTENGMMGPITLAAIARRNPADLTDRLAEERRQFYRSLSTFGTFGEGWTRRVEEVKAASLRMIS
jgi:lysozyme family protein